MQSAKYSPGFLFILVFGGALLASACTTQTESAGCAKDADCKGDRVCSSGQCTTKGGSPGGGETTSGGETATGGAAGSDVAATLKGTTWSIRNTTCKSGLLYTKWFYSLCPNGKTYGGGEYSSLSEGRTFTIPTLQCGTYEIGAPEKSGCDDEWACFSTVNGTVRETNIIIDEKDVLDGVQFQLYYTPTDPSGGEGDALHMAGKCHDIKEYGVYLLKRIEDGETTDADCVSSAAGVCP